MKDSTTERVGRYQLLEPIGTGPCGTVSRAKVFGVAGFERQFAVKRFHPELTITTALAQALSAAARSYGSLEHPRIARMSEFGVAQGQTFTAVEYVAGLDAARLVAEARLAGATLAAGGALALVSQAARAVGYAHGRGLTHLGLSPTNVIVTVDGDVKITDFAILAAGLPPRPVDVARLQQRVQYLAPEQVANEAASAATDVFALGVIAYELVTGQRTFRGETPQQVAQSIMNGPPPEPPLPRPIVRVLQRCLARSPFERFPDARALADALDAALRVAPVPGTRKDIGAQVKQTMDRLAALHDSEMSGMVALNVGTGPIRREAPPAAETAVLGRESHIDLPTSEFVRPDVPVHGPAPLVGPATTMPDLPKPGAMSTIAGLAPPPIAVPPGIGAPPALPPPPAPGGATLLGIANAKAPPTIPTIKAPRSTDPGTAAAPARTPVVPAISKPPTTPPPVTPPPVTPPATPPVVTPPPAAAAPSPSQPTPKPLARIAVGPPRTPPPSTPPSTPLPRTPTDPLNMDELFVENDDPGSTVQEPDSTIPGVAAPPAAVAHNLPTSEMSPVLVNALNEAAIRGTTEIEPLVQDAQRAAAMSEFPDEAPPTHAPLTLTEPEPGPGLALESAPRPTTKRGVAPARASAPALNEAAMPTQAMRHPVAKSGSRAPLFIALGLIVLGGLGFGGWQLYKSKQTEDAPKVVAAPADAREPKPAAPDAGVAVVAVDAATATTADAQQVATAPTPTPAGSSSELSITSKPSGARVYIDGADTGTTPLKLPATPDKHTVALLLAGHELYIAEVDGSGSFQIPLKEVTPPGGPAGIKVIKCKDKERHYVFVDGKPTGQMCPTERIDTEVGPHTVEIYDAVSESRKSWDIVIKDTRLSHRVKVE